MQKGSGNRSPNGRGRRGDRRCLPVVLAAAGRLPGGFADVTYLPETELANLPLFLFLCRDGDGGPVFHRAVHVVRDRLLVDVLGVQAAIRELEHLGSGHLDGEGDALSWAFSQISEAATLMLRSWRTSLV